MTTELAAPRPPVTITVHGRPAPQGSKRAFMGKRKDGTPVARVIESSHDRVKSWRQAVMDAAAEVMAPSWQRDRYPLSGPLDVTMRFYLPRPKSHYGTGRNEHVLKPSAPAYPVKPPDVGKLGRATEDALTICGMYGDDAQIVVSFLDKVWADGHLLGADITIRQLT